MCFWFILDDLSGFLLRRQTRALRNGRDPAQPSRTQKLCVSLLRTIWKSMLWKLSGLSRTFKTKLQEFVPNFGGKCFNITLRSTEAATRLATSSFDYGAERKPLKLLGAKTIHVSVFVAVEFPDQEIVKFLQQYGQLKSENLRRLCYNEEGFTNIERGIRGAEFTSLDRDLPRKVVTQGLEIFFKYTGQPITCYRCGSTEHVMKNCPKQRSRFSHIRADDRILTDPPNPTTPQASLEPQMETNSDETSEDTPPVENSADVSPLTLSYTSVTAPTPDLSLASASQDLFDSQSQQSRKRPPSSCGKAHKPEPKQRAVSDKVKASPTIQGFLRGLKQSGPERTKLMNIIQGPHYYRARALYLQYKHGHFADLDLNHDVRHGLNDREQDAWVQLHCTLGQDAFTELVEMSEDLGWKQPCLFKN